jgi:lipopolysaccharide/colanic/teichoic acid biosynthesis glycosyltransferase
MENAVERTKTNPRSTVNGKTVRRSNMEMPQFAMIIKTGNAIIVTYCLRPSYQAKLLGALLILRNLV